MSAENLDIDELQRRAAVYCSDLLRLRWRQSSDISAYLANEGFRELQTKGLGLYSGLYAFYDVLSEPGPPKLIYCVRDPFTAQIGTVEFPFYAYSDEQWEHDPDVDFKQFVARTVREAEAERSIADFYTILNDPELKRLTSFEQEAGVLYAPDAEFSAFILGSILRMIPGCLTRFSGNPWTAMLPIDQSSVKGLLDQISESFPNKPKILPFTTTLQEIFRTLGLLQDDRLTERYWLLIDWLKEAMETPDVYARLFGENWISLNNREERIANLKRLTDQARLVANEKVLLSFGLVKPVLEALLSNGETVEKFGRRSRIGFENLFAHLVWRSFSPVAKSWIVVPLYKYFLSSKQQETNVAFFLGTFKDTDGDGNKLSSASLSLRIDCIRQCAYAACKDFENVFLKRIVEPKIEALDQKIQDEKEEFKIIGDSPEIQRLRDEIARAAQVDTTVLITGERGTGKRLVAKQIHLNSKRATGRYIDVNCPGLDDNLVISEFFGIKGRVATEVNARRGYFEAAKDGTVVLDEIGDLSLKAQASIKKAIEEGEFRPEGGAEDDPIRLRARIIASTNKDLPAAVRDKTFLGDLYDRIKVRSIHVPPLREHLEDIPLLVDHFIALFNQKHNRRVKKVSQEAIEFMLAYDWPGNVRELRNLIDTAVGDATGETIELYQLPEEIQQANGTKPENLTSTEQAIRESIKEDLIGCHPQKQPKLPSVRHFGKGPGLRREEISLTLCKICNAFDGWLQEMVDGLKYEEAETSEHNLKVWFEKFGIEFADKRLPCRTNTELCVNKRNNGSK